MLSEICSIITDDKAVQKTLREAAVARYAERTAQLKEQQVKVKHEQGRFAVRQQMKVHAAFVCQIFSFVYFLNEQSFVYVCISVFL